MTKRYGMTDSDRSSKEQHKTLRGQGQTNVLVRGCMRLPTWFTVGAQLNRTAGFQVASFQSQTPWSSEGTLSDLAIEQVGTSLGVGEDIAIGVALAFDLSPDVLAYLRGPARWEVGHYVCLAASVRCEATKQSAVLPRLEVLGL